MSESTTTRVSLVDAISMIEALSARVALLESSMKDVSTKKEVSTKEMTDDDARSILTGEFASMKHKETAEKLGLTYGQIYSCRLEFTFKHIHKEMKLQGKSNPWVK